MMMIMRKKGRRVESTSVKSQSNESLIINSNQREVKKLMIGSEGRCDFNRRSAGHDINVIRDNT